MELEGILKACMKKLRTNKAMSAAMRSDSTYSCVLVFRFIYAPETFCPPAAGLSVHDNPK